MSASLDVLCLGEGLVEFNHQGEGRWLEGFGGDVSNVAIAAARQGARAGIATRLGADGFGDALAGLWAAEGVEAVVERDADAPTGLYFVRHGAEGHAFEYRRAGSAASRMSPDNLPLDAVRRARVLHLSGITLAISESARAASMAAMEAARAAGVAVSFDPNLRLSLWPLDRAREAIHAAMRLADIALPGIEDARALTGLDDAGAIVDAYHDLGARVVALTLGAEGALVSDGGGRARVPAFPARAVDATGAGDCFDGAFLARWVGNGDALAAARYAAAAAALSVEGYGAVAPIPTGGRVRAFLADHGGDATDGSGPSPDRAP